MMPAPHAPSGTSMARIATSPKPTAGITLTPCNARRLGTGRPQSLRGLTNLPVSRAEAIARHTSLRGSGRVGRSAAGRSLDEEALTLAVVASVRHQDTDYDSLLMSGVSRAEARDLIRPAVDRLLATLSA